MDAELTFAMQQYGIGDFDGAIATCNGILQAYPAHPAALFCRGMCYEATDDTDAAVEDYERAAAVPGFKEAEIRMAGCYIAKWNFGEALRVYSELAERYPMDQSTGINGTSFVSLGGMSSTGGHSN